MTNTYMLGGDADPGAIVADLKDGIYAVGFGGGQVDITNGKIGAPVKGATLIGDGATALRNIRAIGNDMALDPGMGNCGKAGQWVARLRRPADADDRRADGWGECGVMATSGNQKHFSNFALFVKIL